MAVYGKVQDSFQGYRIVQFNCLPLPVIREYGTHMYLNDLQRSLCLQIPLVLSDLGGLLASFHTARLV